jgi:hypothetical protein
MTDLNTSKTRIATMLLLVALAVTSVAHAQQTTEQYIPIGQSPGISGKYSYIGDIVSVDLDANTITVRGERGTKTVSVLPTTRIWLDRTKAKSSNVAASYSDCEVGRKVEVMYDLDADEVADWIKIEAT